MRAYGLLFFGVIGLIVSILYCIFPKFFMRLKSFMVYTDNEPSDFVFKVNRVISIICVVIFLAMLVVGGVAIVNGDYDLAAFANN